MFGYDTGIISGAQLYFILSWPEITMAQIESVVAIALLGAFMGSIGAGPFSDHFGRKPVIIAADMLFVLGTFILSCAMTISDLLIGRFVVGAAIGISSSVLPVYLSEIAPI